MNVCLLLSTLRPYSSYWSGTPVNLGGVLLAVSWFWCLACGAELGESSGYAPQRTPWILSWWWNLVVNLQSTALNVRLG